MLKSKETIQKILLVDKKIQTMAKKTTSEFVTRFNLGTKKDAAIPKLVFDVL